VAYINSLRHAYGPQLPDGLAWETLVEQVERQIHSRIADQGEYRVAKTTGVFIARNPKGFPKPLGFLRVSRKWRRRACPA